MMKKNKFLILVLITITLIGIVSAVTPAYTRVQISIQNDTIKITGEDIIDWSDTFSVTYNYTTTGEGNCSNMTVNVTSWINYADDVKLIFLGDENFTESGLSCLNSLAECNNKWQQCYNDNLNISVANAVCQQDRGYKDNYTQCQIDLTNTRATITTKDTEITNKQKEVDEVKKDVWWGRVIAFGLGIFGYYLYLRREGKVAPAGSTGYPQEMPVSGEPR